MDEKGHSWALSSIDQNDVICSLGVLRHAWWRLRGGAIQELWPYSIRLDEMIAKIVFVYMNNVMLKLVILAFFYMSHAM